MARINIAGERRVMTRRTLIITALLSAILIGFVLFSNHGIVARIGLASDAGALQQKLSEAKITEDSLRMVIRELEQDTLKIERIARERYGFVRPGERVYVIETDSTQ